jgi:mRNA interferase RelE/StbE
MPTCGNDSGMSRALEWTPAAERDLRRMDPPVRERIRQAVYRLADTGQGDVVRLRGVAREWRLRVGGWRVRFTEDPSGQTMIILRVQPRGGAYR